MSFCVCVCKFGVYKFGKLPVGLEGVALYRNFPFVDCVYQEDLAGDLELEWTWARGSLGLATAGHFGRMAGARVGLDSLVDDLSKSGHERFQCTLCQGHAGGRA